MKPLIVAIIAALPVLAVAGTAAPAPSTDSPRVTFKRLDDRVRIEIGGKHFSDYIHRGWPKPALYPILDADGIGYTRDFPFKRDSTDVPDHDWHRGVWFAHGLVNGHDFWREIPERKTGSIVLDAILETRDGPTGLLRTRSRWVAADGKVICTDETEIRIQRSAAGTVMDYQVRLLASHGPLVLGDTEEGTMAVRVNEALRVTHGKDKDKRPGRGRLVNSAGDSGIPAWGKRAAWCDYSGPLADGTVIGVALLEHPRNPRHPTWWHARDYGLLSANPFGKHDFEKLKSEPNAGDLSIPGGGELVLRYRLIFHRGDEKTARIAEQYRAYAAGQ
jgi:hypothetical protein